MEQKAIKRNSSLVLLNKAVDNSVLNLKRVFILVLLFTCSMGFSQKSKIPKLQPEDIEVISEAYNLWKTKGDEVWEGWSKINMPFIYKKENYEYWIDFPLNTSMGQFVEKIDDMDVYGQPTSDQDGLAASMDVNNIKAVVLSSPQINEMTKEEWIITAIHEMFHVFQSSETYQKRVRDLGIAYGTDASWMLDYPFPYQDTSLQIISHMQGYLLFNIYRSDNLEDNLYDCFLLKDVLYLYEDYIVKQYGNDDDYKYSVFQQSVEGVAKYTEIKMAEIASTDYIPINRGIHFTDVYTNQINVIRHCGKGTGGRLTFYYLGLGMCLVLDKINPGWKDSYLNTAWLDEIFNKSLMQIIDKQKSKKQL